MNKVQSGDVAIHYRRLGNNRGQSPILIVHGLSYFSYDWLPAGEALGAEREVILMDMRGFGDSDWSPKRDYSVPAMAQDIVAVLDDAGWPQAVLIGHSMGGRSTTYAAAKHPARVAALALIDYTPENAPAGAKRTAEIVLGVPPRFRSIEEAMGYFRSKDRDRFVAYTRPAEGGGFVLKRDDFFRDQFRKTAETGERPSLGVDMWALIGEVRCPILSMRGTRSDMYAPATVAKMQAANPRLRVAEVEAGHNVAVENKDGFLKEMRQFLTSVEKGHEHARR